MGGRKSSYGKEIQFCPVCGHPVHEAVCIAVSPSGYECGCASTNFSGGSRKCKRGGRVGSKSKWNAKQGAYR